MTDAAHADLRFVTSPDGQWAVARAGRRLALIAGARGAAVAETELPTHDVDIALVGPPNALIVLAREGDAGHITLYTTPELEAAARLELDTPAKLAAITGPRVAVLSPDSMRAAIVRSAGRALASHKLELAGPIEFAVGLERNQLLLGLPRKLEVWDAVTGRPLLRAQFQLPPAPRIVGTAAGHLWAATAGSEEILLYRLSDGRPFRHHVNAPILEVVCHPMSPIVVVVTSRTLYRLHAYAHSVTPIEGVPPRRGALALHVDGEDISVVGYTEYGAEPWRLPIHGAAAAAAVSAPVAAAGAAPSVAPAPVAPATPPPSPRIAAAARWREPLAAFAQELLRGAEVEVPTVALDNELGELAHRLGLGATARRALAALYGLYLVGEPALPIATLARAIGDWPEALGQGELGALAMLRREHGKVALRTAVTDLLDGVSPRSIRLVGSGATTPRAGMFRVSRDSRSDAEIESELAAQLGRIAIVEGPLPSALLEARLHGATAVALAVPEQRPRPWPRDAGLVLVLYGTTTSWVADLPALSAATTA